MLSPEHIRARRSGGELTVQKLAGKKRRRAAEIAAELLGRARELIGERRSVLEEALKGVETTPAERRLADGLGKLLLDACELEQAPGIDAVDLRRRVFEHAAAQRRELGAGAAFERAGVLEAVAVELGVTAGEIEGGLFSDLRSEERLLNVPSFDAEWLVQSYERGVRQAVLLRAVRVTAQVRCRSPHAYRALFGKLKFRRLLHRIERTDDGYRIVIDGPYSLFESVTKYGLALALVLPALEACDELDLEAEVVWGPRRERLLFRHRHRGRSESEPEPRLADDVQQLLKAFGELSSPWQASPTGALLDLPGVGVCAPDLQFLRASDGLCIYLEVLGFWSREAVWKRVELAERGLREPVLFAVSSRLRVSEDVLPPDGAAALYVYKGVMSPRALERQLNTLAGRIRT